MTLRLLSILVLLAVSGCAIKPGQSRSCAFTRYQLEVPDPAGDRSAGERTLADVLDEAVSPTSRSRRPGAPPGSMLFLSGGSQHGAFGAGYLSGWKEASPSGKLPEFTVVTGISTGAILGTPAFIDRPDLAVNGYTITDERALLAPFVTMQNGQPTAASYVKLLRRGALADLSPLRERLLRMLDDDVLSAVAREGAKGRLLLVGVVDVDSGSAVALDLTAMAKRFVEGDPADRTQARSCYAEAILASSSAPMAALPVFIDDRMYIDGGARFGMFSDQVGDALDRSASLAPASRPTITVIVNGDQQIPQRCGRADPNVCLDGHDPPVTAGSPHAKWKFTALALRSEQILANQVYRFSADSIRAGAAERGIPFRLVRIESDMKDHPSTIRDLSPEAGDNNCAGWHAVDQRLLDPIQFYPRYMRCLIDYGRSRAATDFHRAGAPR